MSKEKPIYMWRRRGQAFIPDSAYDCGLLDGIGEGEAVRLEAKQFRNTGRHRAYWAMLQECVDATGCALNSLVLHDAVKLGTGCVNLVRLKSGMTVAVPGSIAFDKMSEAEFIGYFEAAQQLLARDYGFFSERKEAA